jgi:N-carbamoylputrescine amidase
MNKLRIALLQMRAIMRSVDEYITVGEKFCRQAAEQGADIAVFPEMFSTGYPGPEGDPFALWRAVAFEGAQPDAELIAHESSYAISDDHSYVERFRELALELDMIIAVTYRGKGINAPTNVVLIIDRHGQDLIKYAKIHLFEPFLIDALCEPGEEYFVKELDTRFGPVKLGAMICADRDYPEPARLLMKQGAEIVLIPNACPLEKFSDGMVTDLVRVRAFENAMAIAICNYSSPRLDGHSTAFGADGNIILRAGDDEGVYIAEYDIDEIREYRRTSNLGDAFRKERYYRPLVEAPVPEVFADRKNCVGVIRR